MRGRTPNICVDSGDYYSPLVLLRLFGESVKSFTEAESARTNHGTCYLSCLRVPTGYPCYRTESHVTAIPSRRATGQSALR